MSNKRSRSPLFKDIRLYGRLLNYVMVYKWYFFLGLSLVALFALTTPAVAVLMKPLLDGSFVQRDPDYILWTPIILIILFAIRGIASYLHGVCMSWVLGYVVYDIQTQMIDRMIAFPTQFYDDISAAQINIRISSDVNQLTDTASTVVITIIRESLTILGLLVWIFILDWALSLILLIATPLIATLVAFIARRLRRLYRDFMQMGERLLAHLQEVTAYHRLVKLYQTQNYERERLYNYANRVRQLKLKQAVASHITVPAAEFISTVVIACTVYFSLTRDLTDPLTVGGFVSFMAALALISSSLKKLLRVNEMLQAGLTASERVFFLIDQEVEIDEGKRSMINKKVDGEIQFKNITYKYPKSDASSLSDVSLEIKPRQTIALVGSSGSGKSTLTSLIPRLYEIQDGTLLIDGVDIREYTLADIRSQIALVSQDIFLFDDTVAANIAYGNIENATDEKIREAAKSAYALDFIENLPNGFDTQIGERGVRLSGGQKQRIAIARAFIKDAPILIFDEATSSLDTKSEFEVRKALDALGEGRTVIIVAHRLASIEHVERIVVLNEGRIVEDGTHQELLAREGHYYQLYTVYRETEEQN